jgi:hypothetical protein
LNPIEIYDEYDSLISYYITMIHEKNPASKSYTKKMLYEDIAMVNALWWMSLVPVLYSILNDKWDNPLWPIMNPALTRYLKCMEVTKTAQIVA